MSTVGFIGLGTMGRPMAKNILKAGHRLVFFARRDEVAAEFEALGATRAATPADVTRQSEIVVTIVTADPELQAVVLGPGGVVEGAATGKLLIDMSTVGPDTERLLHARLAERGMHMLDAPVSGGPWGAEQGTLAIMIGGDEHDFQSARPVLEAMGKKLFHVGPIGSGQVVKLINQMVGGGIMTLVAEAFVMGRAAGVNLEQLNDVMLASSAASALQEARGKKFVLAGNFVPGFMTELMRKDMRLAVALATEMNVPTPVAASALQQFTAALHQGLARADFSSVIKVAELAAGVRIHESS